MSDARPPSNKPLGEYLTALARTEELTAADRRLIDVIVADMHLAAFGNAAELAEAAQSSAATVVRSARRLGFAGWTELQEAARQEMRSAPRRATSRIRVGASAPVKAQLVSIADSVGSMATVLDSETFARSVTLLASAKRTVWIASGHEASGIRTLFEDRLRAIRPGVRPVSGDRMIAARAALDIRPRDVLVVMDLARNDAALAELVEVAVAAGASVIGLLDSPAGTLGSQCEIVLPVVGPDVGPFDSYVPMLALVEALAAQVAVVLRDAAVDRLARLESTWERWGLIE